MNSLLYKFVQLLYILFLIQNRLFTQSIATPSTKFDDMEELFNYQTDTIKSDFNERFKQSDDKTNFKKLRDYRSEKENLMIMSENKLKNLYNEIKLLEEDLSNIHSSFTKLKERVSVMDTNVEHSLSTFFTFKNAQKHLLSVGLTIEDSKGKRTYMTDVVYPKLDDLNKNNAAKLKSLNDKVNVILFNMRNAQTDLNLCLNTIDEALAPEYKELQTKIGLGYTVLITLGILLVLLLVGIMIKKINTETISILISDGGLQFVTIFILMIAIILFGILNILEGKELAAILAGISGYVLGRGSRGSIQKKETGENKDNEKEKQN